MGRTASCAFGGDPLSGAQVEIAVRYDVQRGAVSVTFTDGGLKDVQVTLAANGYVSGYLGQQTLFVPAHRSAEHSGYGGNRQLVRFHGHGGGFHEALRGPGRDRPAEHQRSCDGQRLRSPGRGHNHRRLAQVNV